jgi:hypothetical protein
MLMYVLSKNCLRLRSSLTSALEPFWFRLNVYILSTKPDLAVVCISAGLDDDHEVWSREL